ncbi:hypothetical protein BE221DRAFT_60073, partial [Ostreococcus tauri]
MSLDTGSPRAARARLPPSTAAPTPMSNTVAPTAATARQRLPIHLLPSPARALVSPDVARSDARSASDMIGLNTKRS